MLVQLECTGVLGRSVERPNLNLRLLATHWEPLISFNHPQKNYQAPQRCYAAFNYCYFLFAMMTYKLTEYLPDVEMINLKRTVTFIVTPSLPTPGYEINFFDLQLKQQGRFELDENV